VIFITVKDDNTSLIEGFRAGGVDYITKPFEKEELLTRVGNHLKISHLTQELLQKNEELQQEIDRREQEEKAALSKGSWTRFINFRAQGGQAF
jgi:DNA-binding response OmpR family regulator